MASQREVDRIQFLWLLALDAPCFCYHQLEVHSPREPRCDLVLHVEEVHARLIEALRPEMCARFCVDELRIHAQAIRAALNTAFQYVANAKLAADLASIHGLALVCEGSLARDDEIIGQAR